MFIPADFSLSAAALGGGRVFDVISTPPYAGVNRDRSTSTEEILLA